MKNFGWITGSWASALLLALPVLALVFSALSADGDLFGHLADTVLFDYLANTLGLVVGVVLLSLLFGVPTAWLVAMCQVPGAVRLQWALMLPMAMPSYIVAYVYTDLLDYSGPLQAGCVSCLAGAGRPTTGSRPSAPRRRRLGAGAGAVPYVYLLTRASFLEQSVSLIPPAACSVAPLAELSPPQPAAGAPAIMVAVSLVAMETLADFATVHFFAINTLTTAVYDTWLGYGSLATAAKLSCLMLLAVVLLIALGAARAAGSRCSRSRWVMSSRCATRSKDSPRSGRALVLGAGIGRLRPAVPHFAGLRRALLRIVVDAGFVRFAGNSLAISALTALLAMGIALLLGFFRRLDGGVRPVAAAHRRHGLRHAGYRAGHRGAGAADGPRFCHQRSGRVAGSQGPGLLLTGTITAIVFGYLVRFVAIAIGSVESSMGKISPASTWRPAPWGRGWRHVAAGAPAAGAARPVCRCHAGVHRIHEGAARRPAAAAVQLRYPGDPRLPVRVGRCWSAVRSVPSSSCWWGCCR